MSTITLDKSGALKVQTPYNAQLVSMLRSLPTSDRKYDPDSKTWLVSAAHGQIVVSWIAQYVGEVVMLPQVVQKVRTDLTDIFEVRYIGMTKERGESERSAMGYCHGDWSIVFSEPVLRAWFDQAAIPSDESNFYALLSSKRDDPPDAIKSAYRRMARQWHPDVCKEPDAQQQFIKIQHAYEILSNDRTRSKYDAGLALQAMVKPSRDNYQYDSGYRSPLRCGLIMAHGSWSLGRFVVSKILQWEDIIDAQGRTLVVSWPSGSDKFEERWI